jgi:hypothetical protein
MTTRNLLWVLVVGIVLPTGVQSQSPSPPTSIRVNLGEAAVSLYGPWKFAIGDSPINPKTGKPLWAESDFDDSKWEIVDLTPRDGPVALGSGQNAVVPGWMARGHAAHRGYAWYRIRVQVASSGQQQLAMEGPVVDDAYQIFANGVLLGGFGNFARNPPKAYSGQPAIFPLAQTGETASTVQVLAFRVWMEVAPLRDPASGGMRIAPLLGQKGVVTLDYQSKWLEQVRFFAMSPVMAVIFGLLSLMAFSLILFDRSDNVYPWIGFLFLLNAVYDGLDMVSNWTQLIGENEAVYLLGIIGVLAAPVWIIVWWVWFGRVGFRWLPPVLVILTLARYLSYLLKYGAISLQTASRLGTFSFVISLLLDGIMAWIVVDGIRRRGVEGWVVLPVVILRFFSAYFARLLGFHHWLPFGVVVDPTETADILTAFVIAVLLLRRLLQSLKRQREMALDVKQAKEVQEVILPEHRITLNGFEIESEYRPAREVGGDFFQIIPNDRDSNLLIVAGDVVGKGLRAGMLVALLVGAIRSSSESDSDPAAILAALNRRLLGRGDARATCLALRIERDGTVTLANAGHLPPYLNGEPLNIAGSLPLGMIEQLECSVLQFRMAQSNRLLLLSDGVAEATDKEGKLFGFERVLELIRTQPTAEKIAQAAQAFGQEDDISVIAVTRLAVAESALA